MATLSRQPFAPLDGSRLQNLTSLKNRQNAIASPSSSKRKVELVDTDDSENVDPTLSAKRSKGSSSDGTTKVTFKPSAFILTKAPSTATPESRSFATPPPKPVAPSLRRTLQPRSPAAKLTNSLTSVSKSSPIHAPAGRSPTRSKRSGQNAARRRTIGPYSRVDPPSFGTASAAPFSLDAALKGTIPGYGASRPVAPLLSDPERDLKGSLDFEIHEDTPEQEMTNMLQHSTCVLDISSDEESEQKASRETAEGRDKENVPPVDDVSQTSSPRTSRSSPDDMMVEKERVALGEMNASDYYSEGCDESSIFVVPGDDEENQPERAVAGPTELAPDLKLATTALEAQQTIDALISKPNQTSSKAAVLEPIEGTGESFELWESGSAKDETEAVAASS